MSARVAMNAFGLAVLACTTDLPVAENFTSPASTGSGGGKGMDSAVLPTPSRGDAASALDASSMLDAASGCVPRACRGRMRACGNCQHDDEDGLADLADPDCWGACDDDETQLSSATVCPTEACFFDPDCGAGNDEQCLEKTLAGCDCHGCCSVPGESYAVQLGKVSGGENICTSDALTDEAACSRCEIDAACAKECVPCEPCFGMPVPASCSD